MPSQPSKATNTKLEKRKATGYVVITRENVDTPEAQGAIYKSTLDEARPLSSRRRRPRTPTFALVVGVKDDGFYVTMEKGAREKAAELGVESRR